MVMENFVGDATVYCGVAALVLFVLACIAGVFARPKVGDVLLRVSFMFVMLTALFYFVWLVLKIAETYG